MLAEYRIKSVQTNNFVVSNGKEMPGDRVMTTPAPEMKPAETIICFNPPLNPPIGGNGSSSMMGKAGLYIAVAKEEAGEHLIWRKEAFVWDIATNGPQFTHSIHAPGKDLYWFDKTNYEIGRSLILQPGPGAREKEIFFILEKLA
ncbi:hypothetical protein F5887DRAFT_1282671 [Amanita rubescens]|nr:hypothetical protein F5887DRAFT_1282671 [Amanita rubescens]